LDKARLDDALELATGWCKVFIHVILVPNPMSMAAKLVPNPSIQVQTPGRIGAARRIPLVSKQNELGYSGSMGFIH